MIFNVTGKLLDACVLGILQEKDAYGYDLTQTVGNYMEVSESTLYPVLRRLSKDGYLTSYHTLIDGRSRKYYHMTPQGELLLQQYVQDWNTHKNIVTSLIEGGKTHDQTRIFKEIG